MWVGVAFESGATSGPDEPRLQMAERQKLDMDQVLAGFDGTPPTISAQLVEGDPVDVLTAAARNSDRRSCSAATAKGACPARCSAPSARAACAVAQPLC